MKHYNIAGLTAIYGQRPHLDTPALVELGRWRTRADELIREAHVTPGLELVAVVSELTREYRRNRRQLLAPSDRQRLAAIVASAAQDRMVLGG